MHRASAEVPKRVTTRVDNARDPQEYEDRGSQRREPAFSVQPREQERRIPSKWRRGLRASAQGYRVPRRKAELRLCDRERHGTPRIQLLRLGRLVRPFTAGVSHRHRPIKTGHQFHVAQPQPVPEQQQDKGRMDRQLPLSRLNLRYLWYLSRYSFVISMTVIHLGFLNRSVMLVCNHEG